MEEERFEVHRTDATGISIYSMTKEEIITCVANGEWLFVDGQMVDTSAISAIAEIDFAQVGSLVFGPQIHGSYPPQVKVKTLSKKGKWKISEENVSNILGEEYFVYIDGAYIPPTTELQEKDLESWQDIRRYRKVREWTD